MSTDPQDGSNFDQERLDEVRRQLDALPPEVVRQAILDAGLPEKALDALVDVARNAPDEADRAEARRIISEYNLDLILLGDADPPLRDESE